MKLGAFAGIAAVCATSLVGSGGCSSPRASSPRLAAGRGVAPQKGGEDDSGPYEVDPSWPQPLSSELTLGRTSSIFTACPTPRFVLPCGMLPLASQRFD